MDIKIRAEKKNANRWAGEDQFVTKMGSSQKLAKMDLFI